MPSFFDSTPPTMKGEEPLLVGIFPETTNCTVYIYVFSLLGVRIIRAIEDRFIIA